MGRGISTLTQQRLDVVYAYAEENEPVTVRGCAYHLFTKGLIESMARKYVAEVSRILVKARKDGFIPWEWIVDESREAEVVPSWSNMAEYGESIARWYRKDRWLDQDY